MLFQLQPLMGRQLLPWFGGGPAVWSTCLLFFQTLLLAGYLYAHLISVKLTVRQQGLVNLGLVLASLLALPIGLAEDWKPEAGGAPAAKVLCLLLVVIGAPYFMLASTSPLLQRWFSQSFAGRSPYRLYALSNFGSLLALLSYPLVVEPMLGLRSQELIWSGTYTAYAALAAWCSIRMALLKANPLASAAGGEIKERAATGETGSRPGAGRMLLWLGLATAGSALLMATTNQLCLDVASVPFLWILPLTLYLLTFIICFDSPRWFDRRVFGLLLMAAAPAACWLLSPIIETDAVPQIAIYAGVLFAGCMTCHGELALSRPEPRHLTWFYLLVSLGGALGGLLVALVAPLIFSGFWEYHVALAGVCLLTLIAWCAGRVWRGHYSMVFWNWALATAVHIGLTTVLVYWPCSKEITPSDLTVLCGGAAAVWLGGWLLTAVWEDRPRLLPWSWIGISVAQLVWLVAFACWKYPELVPASRYAWLALGIGLTTCASLLLAALSRRRLNELWRRRLLVGSFQILCLGGLAAVAIAHPTQGAMLAGVYALSLGAGLCWKPWTFRAYWERGVWLWAAGVAALVMLTMTLNGLAREEAAGLVYASRNFYGVLRVTQEEDEFGEYYLLQHGSTDHGLQYLDERLSQKPTAYYTEETGVGLALRYHPRRRAAGQAERNLRVGIIGLGAGVLAAYGQPGDYYRFYEINPDTVRLAKSRFTYLENASARIDVVLGDARIMLERELARDDGQKFDALIVDAFSSDAIPVHLLTAECAEVYRRHLKPDGLLLFHISNRYLDLNPVVRALGEHLGWQAIRIETEEDEENYEDEGVSAYGTTWVILTANQRFVKRRTIQNASRPWENDEPQSLLWTDDFAGLWQVIVR